MGPLMISRLRYEDMRHQDKPFELSNTAAAILSDPEVESNAVHKELDAVCLHLVRLLHTLSKDPKRSDLVEHMLDVGVEFVRARTTKPPSAAAALKAFNQILATELREN
jgi:hypothetical protein